MEFFKIANSKWFLQTKIAVFWSLKVDCMFLNINIFYRILADVSFQEKMCSVKRKNALCLSKMAVFWDKWSLNLYRVYEYSGYERIWLYIQQTWVNYFEMSMISKMVYTTIPGNTPIAPCILMCMRSHMFIIVDYGMCLLLHLFSCHFSNVVYNNIIIIHAVYNIL